MIRWKRLENFPKHVMNGISKHFFDNWKQNIATVKYQVYPAMGTRQHLRVVTIDYPVNLPGFHDCVSFFISDPKIGVATVHIDRSSTYSLNFPIQVGEGDGQYIAGIHTDLNLYKGRQTFTINGKTGITYEYHPEDFEDVFLTGMTLVNTSIPHSWTNNSSDYRVVGSLFMKYSDINEVWKHVEQWT